MFSRTIAIVGDGAAETVGNTDRHLARTAVTSDAIQSVNASTGLHFLKKHPTDETYPITSSLLYLLVHNALVYGNCLNMYSHRLNQRSIIIFSATSACLLCSFMWQILILTKSMNHT